MAVTPNYSWPVPVNTDYVKDGAEAIKDLGDAIDATVFGLPSGGLTLIKTQVIGSAVSSVTVSGAFSATYDNYKIIISNLVGSAGTTLNFNFIGSTANYYSALSGAVYATGVPYILTANNQADMKFFGTSDPAYGFANCDVLQPFLAKPSAIMGGVVAATIAGFTGCYHSPATSYTDFKVAPVSGTITGSVKVYGYKES